MVTRKSNKYKTSLLYKIPNFWIGFGSIWGIFGNFFNFKKYDSAKQADFEALENDWGVIGNDLEYSIGEYLKNSKIEHTRLSKKEINKLKSKLDIIERKIILSQMQDLTLIEQTKRLKKISSIVSKQHIESLQRRNRRAKTK